MLVPCMQHWFCPTEQKSQSHQPLCTGGCFLLPISRCKWGEAPGWSRTWSCLSSAQGAQPNLRLRGQQFPGPMSLFIISPDAFFTLQTVQLLLLDYLAKDHCRGQSKGQHPPFKLTDRIAVTWTHALSQAWGLPGYFPPSGEADETNQIYMYLQIQNGIFLQNIHTLLYPPKSANSSQSHLQGYLVAFFAL